jgi:hypothetical protein
MTHDTTPDASAAAIARSLQQWVRIEIAKGHPARMVLDAIEQEAAMIQLQRKGQNSLDESADAFHSPPET